MSIILLQYDLTVYRDIREFDLKNTVVTVGNFDGVHCGHRILLSRAVDLASKNGLSSVALTFWPHPKQILNKKGETYLLLDTLDEKITLLEHTGIDSVAVFPFDGDLSRMPASDFVSDIIVGKLDAQYLLVGRDHHFGSGRGGNVRRLPEFASHSDLKIEVVELKKLDRKISSSAIRNALLRGDLTLANRMLGYEYMISGKVIAGNRLGRTIGFPTANVETPEYKLLPMEGVYRVRVKIGNGNFDRIGMLHIGKRTVLESEDAATHVEVNIFDFDGQIYGHEITLSLTHRIRDSVRFDDIEQLAVQLRRDKEKIASSV